MPIGEERREEPPEVLPEEDEPEDEVDVVLPLPIVTAL